MSEQKPKDSVDIMVVGATIHLDGIVTEVVAVAPPEASLLAPHPEAFQTYGDVAITVVGEGRALRESSTIATEIMYNDAERSGMIHSRQVGSVALNGTHTLPQLQHRTNRNLR